MELRSLMNNGDKMKCDTHFKRPHNVVKGTITFFFDDYIFTTTILLLMLNLMSLNDSRYFNNSSRLLLRE